MGRVEHGTYLAIKLLAITKVKNEKGISMNMSSA